MEDELAEDLAAMWRSELAAIATDREIRENWTALTALWVVAALAVARPGDEPAPGGADAVQPARTEAAAAASEPGPAAVERLERRIAGLERRLATFERDGGPG